MAFATAIALIGTPGCGRHGPQPLPAEVLEADPSLDIDLDGADAGDVQSTTGRGPEVGA